LFEKPRGQFEGIVTQTYGDPGYIRDRLDGDPHGFAEEGTLRVGRDIAHGPDLGTQPEM
jgi:hypothetical protein